MKWLIPLLLVTSAGATWDDPTPVWQVLADGELHVTSEGLLVEGNSNLILADGEIIQTLPDGAFMGGGILAGTTLYDLQGNQIQTFAGEPIIAENGFLTFGTTLHQLQNGQLLQLSAETCEGASFTPRGSSGSGFVAAFDEENVALYENQQLLWSVQTTAHNVIIADYVYIISNTGLISAYEIRNDCNPTPEWTAQTFLENPPFFAGYQENLIVGFHQSPERPQNGSFVEAFAANGTKAWGYQLDHTRDIAIHETGILFTGNQTQIINPETGRTISTITQAATSSAIDNYIYLSNGLVTAFSEFKKETLPSTSQETENGGDVVTIPVGFVAPIVLIALRRFYS